MSVLVKTVAAARYAEIVCELFQGIYAEKPGQPIRRDAIWGLLCFFSNAELEKGHQWGNPLLWIVSPALHLKKEWIYVEEEINNFEKAVDPLGMRGRMVGQQADLVG